MVVISFFKIHYWQIIFQLCPNKVQLLLNLENVFIACVELYIRAVITRCIVVLNCTFEL